MCYRVPNTLQLPPASSTLTASPNDDFEKMEGWIELHMEPTSGGSSAFWYVMGQFTRTLHWNRTIFEVNMHAEALQPYDSTTEVPQIGEYVLPTVDAPAPPRNARYLALRELLRKMASPIGGGPDGTESSYACHEWTTQYIVPFETGERHVAVFGLVLPACIIGDDNPRGMTYWPFHYPKARCYRYSWEPATDGVSGKLRFAVLPLGDDVPTRPGTRPMTDVLQHARRSTAKQLVQVRKRIEHFDPVRNISTYVKRVVHDTLVPEKLYRLHYARLKKRYSHWVKTWSATEVTDPVKYVYEEMSIAAYLCALWELERGDNTEKQSFIDCGCGNGFLVYLLIMEGHPGAGVDMQKRRIWERYPPAVRDALRHEEVDPATFDCKGFDWIVGNHSDELTPWLPVFAARAQQSGAGMSPKLFVLPCCFYDFDGKKIAFGNRRRTVPVPDKGCDGKYDQYVTWIERICMAVGLEVVLENLRIPSTKYKSIICTKISHVERIDTDVVERLVRLLTLDARLSHS